MRRTYTDVVAGQVFEAVGELLAAREQLLEVAEAAGHRLAPCVDDLRVRQHQVDQADVAIVVRHLVDEERRAAAAVVPRVADVGFAEFPEFVLPSPPRGRRGNACRSHAGRARSRGAGCRPAPSCPRPRECEARICSSSVDPARGRPTMKIGEPSGNPSRAAARRTRACRVPSAVTACAPARRAGNVLFRLLERVAAGVEAEGLLVLAAVLECLAERETQVSAVGRRRAAARRRARACGRARHR